MLFGVIGCGADGSAQVCVDHCPNVTFSVYDQITKREKDVAAEEKKVDDSWLERMICKYHVGVPTPQNVSVQREESYCKNIKASLTSFRWKNSGNGAIVQRTTLKVNRVSAIEVIEIQLNLFSVSTVLNRCIPKVIRFTEDEKAVDEMQKEVMQLNVSGMAALTLNTAEQVTE